MNWRSVREAAVKYDSPHALLSTCRRHDQSGQQPSKKLASPHCASSILSDDTSLGLLKASCRPSYCSTGHRTSTQAPLAICQRNEITKRPPVSTGSKTDIAPRGHCRFHPNFVATHNPPSLDHLIGQKKQGRRHFESKGLPCLEVNRESKLDWLL